MQALNMRDNIKEYLRMEEELGDKIYDDCDGDGLKHEHICDYELLLGESYRDKKSVAAQKCREWLKSQGRFRDKYLNCCDICPHMKYVIIDEETETILNVSCSHKWCFDEKHFNQFDDILAEAGEEEVEE